MTEKELSQCHYLSLEIKRLRDELDELEGTEYRGINLTGMPHGTGISDSTGKLGTRRADFAEQIAELHELIALNIKKCLIERTRIERFIETIEDCEMRMFVRLRCINCLKWEDIAAETMLMDDDGNVIKEAQNRTTVMRKFAKFIKDQ